MMGMMGFLLFVFFSVALGSCAASSGGNFELCRQKFIQAAFGQPTLPSRPPDKEEKMSNLHRNNQTRYSWLITDPLFNGTAPELWAHVYLTLNSSGHAMPNYVTGPILKGGEYRWPHWPQNTQRTLLLYHNGHETFDGATDFDGVVWYFNTLGFDVAEFDMPLYGFNKKLGIPSDHSYFGPYQDKGVHCLRYFVEPVVLMVDYALNHLGYKQVAMLGLSGGGWTTAMAAALDLRISQSFPTAGGLPFHMYNRTFDSRDWEQDPQRPWYAVADMTDIFALGGLAQKQPRFQLQILHEMDSCCWTACTRHADILAYNAQIRNMANSTFRTVVTTGNIHEVNPRDKLIVGTLVQLWSQQGAMPNILNVPIPFDIL